MPEATTNGVAPVQVKPGRHREATLYHALAGAGAGNGRTLEQLREAALRSYETSELPVWRRSGFWTTSLQSLDLDALKGRLHAKADELGLKIEAQHEDVFKFMHRV